MPAIIDILTPSQGNCPSFVATNAADYVSIPPTVSAVDMLSAGGFGTFQPGDSFQVLSVGLRLPEAFTLYTLNTDPFPVPNMFMGAFDGVEYYSNPNLPRSIIEIPFENYELVLDFFYNCSLSKGMIHPTKTLNQTSFSLQSVMGSLNISMLGVPAALVNKVFYAVPFFKISHNFQLT